MRFSINQLDHFGFNLGGSYPISDAIKDRLKAYADAAIRYDRNPTPGLVIVSFHTDAIFNAGALVSDLFLTIKAVPFTEKVYRDASPEIYEVDCLVVHSVLSDMPNWILAKLTNIISVREAAEKTTLIHILGRGEENINENFLAFLMAKRGRYFHDILIIEDE